LREKERRHKIAEEAAKLLYYKLARDYKQAKKTACKALNEQVFPSNLEVAIEIDKFADEMESTTRRTLNIRLRQESLQLMKYLKEFNPRLIGGVWRGTAKKGSDIDIIVYSHSVALVYNVIKTKYTILKAEYSDKTANGKTEKYYHIHLLLESGDNVEVIVKDLPYMKEKRRCEIYGDYITGFSIGQLQKILATDPTKKIIPKMGSKRIH
jgi:predicted nucleotidyltransferase